MNSKTLLPVALFAAFLAAFLFFFQSQNPTPEAPCPMDAKICADGSSVGRVAPSCEFAECPLSNEGDPGTAPQNPAEPIPQEPENSVCTQDVKLCADGSYVSRRGSKCEFAPCPILASTITETLKLFEQKSVWGVKIHVEEITEDSRCPIDVTCVQAGTIALKVTLTNASGSSTYNMALGGSASLGSDMVTFKEATPLPREGVQIKREEHRFVFEVKKK